MIIIDRFEGEYAVCEEEDGRFRKNKNEYTKEGLK